MHEWSLAEAVVETVLKIAKEENAEKIIEVDIVVGVLQSIDMEAFRFALTEISRDTPMKDAKINIEFEEPTFKCRVCGNEWSFTDIKNKLGEDEIEAIHFIPDLAHTFISCPKCGSPDFEILRGRGVYLRSIKVA